MRLCSGLRQTCEPTPEPSLGVGGRGAFDRLERDPAKLSHLVGGVNDERGLARFSSMGNGAQVGTVGLDEDAILGSDRGDLLDGARAFERDDAGKREVESQIQRTFREGEVFAEAVDEPANIARTFGLEDGERVGGGFARMDDDRLADVTCQRDQSSEHALLNVARRMVVVIVEPDLSDGHHVLVTREDAELLEHGIVAPGCVVRMNADRGGDLHWVRARESYGGASGRDRMTDADDHEASNAGGTRAREDGIGPFGEVFFVEVTVSVDEHDLS